MLTSSRRPIVFPPTHAAARPLSKAIVAIGLALAAAPAVADSDYPPGLFENSPVVGRDGAPVAPPRSGATAPSTSNAPATAEPPGVPGSSGDPTDSGEPDFAAPSEPPGSIPPGPREAFAPPSSRSAYCAGIANRVFGSLEEVQRAHAMCGRAGYAARPPGYPAPN